MIVPLTWVKALWVFPFFLIMVQRPQIDDHPSSFLNSKVSNAAEKDMKAQWGTRPPAWNDAGGRDCPLRGTDPVPGVTEGNVGDEKRSHGTDP